MQYVPAFDIRIKAFVRPVTVVPFQDTPRKPFTITTQPRALAAPVFEALKNYVEYIDETWRQTANLRDVISGFSSSAAYYKGLDNYARVGGMQFSNKDFKLPLSAYQKAVAGSKVLPPAYAQALNQQAGVLQDIMREFYALSALLEEEVKARRYEQDHVTHIYTVLERHAVLFKVWDERKEQLYNDVRAIFDSYPPAAASSSWYVSGKALANLMDLDREGLFKAKRFYNGDSTITVSVKAIRQSVRDVISAEYDNMKGIEKIGRNNGLCPYTPYEDLPEYSQSLSKSLEELKPAGDKDPNGYQHPYHEMVYRYNEVVDCYNKFCELARVPLLPAVHQPELFAVNYPKAQKKQPAVIAQDNGQQSGGSLGKPRDYRPADRPPVNQPPLVTTQVVHDTVYIEKRDTVYIAPPGEDLHSMEGYAINHMVLLLDVSGSMEAPEKLPLLKESVLGLMAMMRPEDKVSIISFSGKPKVLLESTSFKDEVRIRKAIEALRPSGKTDGDAGLKLAYEVADDHYLRGGNNRILLATDGEFPLDDNTMGLIQKFAGQDIFLSVFNFGRSPHAAQKLAQLAAGGHGNYTPITRQNIERGLIREAKSKKKAQ
jgi:Mg-chelatase subunit ChlD